MVTTDPKKIAFKIAVVKVTTMTKAISNSRKNWIIAFQRRQNLNVKKLGTSKQLFKKTHTV